MTNQSIPLLLTLFFISDLQIKLCIHCSSKNIFILFSIFFIITILVLLYSKGEELQCQMQLIDQSICLKQSINQTLLLYRDQLYPYHFISGLSPFSLSHPFKVEPPPATECQPQFQYNSQCCPK